MLYRYETDLVNDFLCCINKSKFGKHQSIQYITEFDYRNARPDIVFLNQHHQIVSVEAKLSNWKKALEQAYRNTCFSDYSYILLPENKIELVLKYQQEFVNRSVGICYISNGRIKLPLESKVNQPLFQWLKDKAIHQIETRGIYGLPC